MDALLVKAERVEHDVCVRAWEARERGEASGKAPPVMGQRDGAAAKGSGKGAKGDGLHGPSKGGAGLRKGAAKGAGAIGKAARGGPGKSADDPVVDLYFEGTVENELNVVVVDGTRCHVQMAPFVPLLRLAVVQMKKPGQAVDGDEVGFLTKSPNPKRIREQLAPGMPEGVDIIVSHGGGRWGLYKGARIGGDWEAFEEHRMEIVKKIARALRGKT